MNENQKKALEYLKKNKSIKSETYAKLNKVSNTTAVNQINEMVEFGYIRKVGKFRGAYYVLKES